MIRQNDKATSNLDSVYNTEPLDPKPGPSRSGPSRQSPSKQEQDPPKQGPSKPPKSPVTHDDEFQGEEINKADSPESRSFTPKAPEETTADLDEIIIRESDKQVMAYTDPKDRRHRQVWEQLVRDINDPEARRRSLEYEEAKANWLRDPKCCTCFTCCCRGVEGPPKPKVPLKTRIKQQWKTAKEVMFVDQNVKPKHPIKVMEEYEEWLNEERARRARLGLAPISDQWRPDQPKMNLLADYHPSYRYENFWSPASGT